MALSLRLRRLLGAAALLSLAACDSQFADPIRELGQASPSDPCGAWSSQSECEADVSHGCSFQPNLIGCQTDDPSCAAGICRGGDPFVRRSGETLWLAGSPYRFVGAVSWGVAYGSGGCTITSFPEPEAGVARTFDELADMRASVLKVWAFQDYAGDTGADYAAFDRIVSHARRAGMRVILVLENMWQDCTRGGRDDAWFAGGFRQPYGGYALSYTDYVAGLVRHFRDEPTILAWQLMHEAGGADFAALSGFAGEISSLVRATDPNHLIALGTDNGGSPATSIAGEPSNFARLHELPAIDLLDVHDFTEQPDALPPSFVEVGSVGRSLGKPVFAGATAVTLADASPEAFRVRGQIVEAKLEAAFQQQFVGFLVYDYYPRWQELNWSFDARAEEPLAGPDGIIAAHAPPR